MLNSYIFRNIKIENLDEDLIPHVEFLDRWYNLPSDHPARESVHYIKELDIAHNNVLKIIEFIPRKERTADEKKLKRISEKELRWIEKYV